MNGKDYTNVAEAALAVRNARCGKLEKAMKRKLISMMEDMGFVVVLPAGNSVERGGRTLDVKNISFQELLDFYQAHEEKIEDQVGSGGRCRAVGGDLGKCSERSIELKQPRCRLKTQEDHVTATAATNAKDRETSVSQSGSPYVQLPTTRLWRTPVDRSLRWHPQANTMREIARLSRKLPHQFHRLRTSGSIAPPGVDMATSPSRPDATKCGQLCA